MLLPALSLKDIEDMCIKEIEQRIIFLSNLKQEKQKIDLRNLVSTMYLAISAGSSPSKKNNRNFYKSLDKLFTDKKPIPDEKECLDDIEDLIKNKQ